MQLQEENILCKCVIPTWSVWQQWHNSTATNKPPGERDTGFDKHQQRYSKPLVKLFP